VIKEHNIIQHYGFVPDSNPDDCRSSILTIRVLSQLKNCVPSNITGNLYCRLDNNLTKDYEKLFNFVITNVITNMSLFKNNNYFDHYIFMTLLLRRLYEVNQV